MVPEYMVLYKKIMGRGLLIKGWGYYLGVCV